MAKLFENLDWKTVGGLLLLSAAVTVFWDTFAVYPLKILVVFFHELSHGLSAVISGGSIVRIELVAQQGGLCVTMGGSRFLVMSAGYLGSLLMGGAVLLLAARTRWDRALSIFLGLLLVGVALWLIRPFGSFGFFFGLLSGLALIATGVFLPEGINDFLLRLIGLTSCLYAVLDIKSDILDRPELRSDAAMLAEYTGLPTIFWGVLWIVIAVVAAFFFLLFACQKVSQKPSTSSGSDSQVA